jgi:SAM-dependent methyltransferase
MSTLPALNPQVQALLRCPGLGIDSPRCGGELAIEAGAIRCLACGRRYPVIWGTPRFTDLNDDDKYAKRDTLRMYYEMHYGPFLDCPERATQLAFPQSPVSSKRGGGPGVETFSAAAASIEEKATQVFDYHDLTEAFYRSLLQMCGDLMKGRAVLDVGCALGRMTLEAVEAGARIAVGLDRSPLFVNEARRLAFGTRTQISFGYPGQPQLTGAVDRGKSLQAASVDFVVADALKLPFDANSFDFCFCLNLLDRVPAPSALVAELERVLRPGGHLLITDPYHWEESPVTDERLWIWDMTTLFPDSGWQRVRETDGIPFVIRPSSRRVTIYRSHTLLYERCPSTTATP